MEKVLLTAFVHVLRNGTGTDFMPGPDAALLVEVHQHAAKVEHNIVNVFQYLLHEPFCCLLSNAPTAFASRCCAPEVQRYE